MLERSKNFGRAETAPPLLRSLNNNVAIGTLTLVTVACVISGSYSEM